MAERVSLTLNGTLLSPPPTTTTTTMSSSLRSTTAASLLLRSSSSSSRSTLTLSASSSLSFVRSLVSSPRLSSSSSLSQKKYRIASVNRSFNSTTAATKSSSSDPDQLKNAREDIKELLSTKFCHPILVRLGWHDAGTYNKNIKEWPQRGGANGSLRFDIELKHAANAGLVNALNLIKDIKEKYSGISYADLFQLASATAIEEAGGPKIPMKYGRVDASGPEDCPEEGRLPDAGPPSPATHLREVFYRMGLDDKDIVALSGAHTLGRSRPERSGWGKPETKYTKEGPGAPGGQSWTPEWLKFDNSYFKVYAEKYAADQDAFFKDYAVAHAKLSNLGAEFNPPEGIVI
ncbi:stromal ascorbate peroxidase [Arabidopsis thaliana]|uniref:L-ascorbate peroxidase n=1 Tax=Arabidopsis thaliana TaxID=3702 RepID=F4JFY4_ARATH|nr:stromal ascorbate peroxidase [Arabidopsis thaliana]AEE82637.1 stromal ascorbate peroxidase [Arabidopsis thaliana]|eukprot:NP_001190690.1 stromal ascorbate peroxidase [Arabidopsis thaliana]